MAGLLIRRRRVLELLGISRNKLDAMISEKIVKPRKLGHGGKRWFVESEILKLVREGGE